MGVIIHRRIRITTKIEPAFVTSGDHLNSYYTGYNSPAEEVWQPHDLVGKIGMMHGSEFTLPDSNNEDEMWHLSGSEVIAGGSNEVGSRVGKYYVNIAGYIGYTSPTIPYVGCAIIKNTGFTDFDKKEKVLDDNAPMTNDGKIFVTAKWDEDDNDSDYIIGSLSPRHGGQSMLIPWTDYGFVDGDTKKIGDFGYFKAQGSKSVLVEKTVIYSDNAMSDRFGND